MQSANPFPKQWGLIVAASLVAAAIIVIAMLATGTTAWAQSNPQKAPVTGLSATSGSNPGEIDVSWDAHPAGATEYRVAWAPDGGSFRRPGNTNWNAKPTATGMTIAGLTEGSDYKVKVRARFDSNPKSRWSSVATATATEAPQPTPTPEPTPEPTPPPPSTEPPPSPTPAPPDYAADRVTGLGLDVSNTSIRPLVIDYSVDGDGNPRDYYNFQLGESAEVSLSLRKLDFNADLFLEDKYGNVLASSENQGTVNEDIVATLPVGNDYHIRVEALEPGQNDYRLRIVASEPNDATLVTAPEATPPPQRPLPPPRRPATAVVETQTTEPEPPAEPLTSQQQDGDTTPADTSTTEVAEINTPRSVVIETADDRDWIKVDLENGKKYLFEVSGHRGSTYTPAVVPALHGIRDPDGDPIANTENLSHCYWNYVMIYYRAQESGTHYVDLGAQDGTSGSLILHVELKSDDDYPDDSTTTGSVAVGSSVTGRIDTTTDKDWFSASLETGKAYRIDMRQTGSDCDGIDNPRIDGIFDAGSERIPHTANEDDGWWLDARVYIEPASTGTHYIGVAGADGTRGRYTVAVTEVGLDLPSDTTTTATVSAGGAPYQGDINRKGDQDWVKSDLTTGAAYLIEMKGATRYGRDGIDDPYIRRVYDKDGNAIRGTQDTRRYDSGYLAPPMDGLVYLEPSETATHYIEVSDDDYHMQGRYWLKVTEVALDYPKNGSTEAEVAVGGTKTGMLEVSGDTDWIKVTLTEDEEYVIHARGSRTDDGTLYNPLIESIYGPDESAIPGTRDDNSGTGKNARVDFTASEDGVHYISVSWGAPGCLHSCYKDTQGTYTVEVEDVDSDGD